MLPPSKRCDRSTFPFSSGECGLMYTFRSRFSESIRRLPTTTVN